MLPRWLAAALLVLVPVALLVAVHLVNLQVTGNFHEVVPGKLYRSAQLSAEDLAAYGRANGIRSVINLRGENRGVSWYDSEVAISRELGLVHLDFRMSAGRPLSPKEAAHLIALMRDAPKPLLIHCRAGADRSGLAASLYLAAIDGDGEERSEAQLSFRFGHIGIPWLSQSYAMDETWEALEPWLGYGGS
jgi:protein tyrosine/serine phosphatase